MAQFIRINKESFASGLNITADVLIGVDNIRSVIKGSQASIGDANACTIYFDNYDGSNGYMEFEDTAKGVDIANAINYAITANPGGVVANVVFRNDVEIDSLVLA